MGLSRRTAFRVRASCVALAFALAGARAAAAEPVTLKVSFWSSDRSPAYVSLVKPFVDAINRDGGELLRAQVYFSGALSPVQSEQPRIVLDGTADIAFIVPGQNPERFVDTGAIELPGLFRDTREASLVYTRLVAANALRGYEDFFAVATIGTYPESIHSRKRLVSLADLKGQKLRVNNPTQGAAVAKLGVLPTVVAINEVSNAIASGALDGLVVQPAQLADVGAHRLVSNHYLLSVSSAPLTLLMNRKLFERLPQAAQAIIRKYSGEWAALRYVETSDAFNEEVIRQIKTDPRRHVTLPTVSETAEAQRMFDAVAEEWASKSPRNRELLALVRAELEKVRAGR